MVTGAFRVNTTVRDATTRGAWVYVSPWGGGHVLSFEPGQWVEVDFGGSCTQGASRRPVQGGLVSNGRCSSGE